jgi:hypothetical protein
MKSSKDRLKLRLLFILGISLIPIGFALDVIALTAVGGLFFIIAISNRNEW